jgi:hypothetical protein
MPTSSSPLTVKEWDSASSKQRIKLLKDFIARYTCEGIDGYDTERMNDELQNIIFLISRIVAALEITLQRSNSIHLHVSVLCALIATSEGQTFAESSPNAITVLMQCLQSDLKSKENDLSVSLVMIRRTCSLNEKLRNLIVDSRGMDILGVILQLNESSQKIQDEACAFLLDLSTLNENTSLAFSTILRSLVNSPFLLSKASAVKLFSSILITASPIQINFSDWEHEFIVQMTRVLLCAPLQYQYDASELISMLFEHENDVVREGLMTTISALLCVRYTVGGHSIVDPPEHWDYLFPSADADDVVHEVPEVLYPPTTRFLNLIRSL